MALLRIVGLGPAGLDRIPGPVRDLLVDPGRPVLVRTLEHPAAAELAAARPVATGDDLYAAAGDLTSVYRLLADRALEMAAAGEAVYAVPGSPLVGERSVEIVRELAAGRGVEVEILQAESFLDLVFARAGLDPLRGGVQVIDGRDLPYPLLLHMPTIIAQVDRPMVAADVKDALGRVLSPTTAVLVLSDLGDAGEQTVTVELSDLDRVEVGPRTTLVLDPAPPGWPGLVTTSERLRRECPWDARQTHHSLVRHLIEETYEVVEALAVLPPSAPGGDPDPAAYVDLEEELGDLLLQVVFHATMAREAGMFDVEEVAERMRRKLVHRHPHVFGDVVVSGADEVLANWERIKQDEKGRESLMDDVPAALPSLARAAKLQRRAASVGFDWSEPGPVVDKLAEELDEVRAVLADPAAAADELGDVLFSVVNLSRHLDVDAEMALRRATDRFADRFRSMESLGRLEGLSLEELDERWQRAKAAGEIPGRPGSP